MKISRLLALASLALGAGCNSLDNPLSGFRIFQTGHDARTFNPQTGQYELSHDATPRPKIKTAPVSGAATATPAPQKNHDRAYDPQKGAFADPAQ